MKTRMNSRVRKGLLIRCIAMPSVGPLKKTVADSAEDAREETTAPAPGMSVPG